MSIKSEARDFFQKSVEKIPNLLIIIGAAVFCLAYASYYDEKIHFPNSEYTPGILILGLVLILSGIIIHLFFREKEFRKLKNNTILKIHSSIVTIKIGQLENADNLTNDSAFVLPANSTFADDCVTDTKTALGSFFNKHHPDKVGQFNQKLKTVLFSKGIQQTDGNYPASTAIV